MPVEERSTASTRDIQDGGNQIAAAVECARLGNRMIAGAVIATGQRDDVTADGVVDAVDVSRTGNGISNP